VQKDFCNNICQQLPLGAGIKRVRYAPISGPYLKLIDWPKGARSRQICSTAKAQLLNNLVGARKQRRRHYEANRFGGFEIDDLLKPSWLLHRYLACCFRSEYLLNVACRLAVHVAQIRAE
jgi:hypothetical protein